MTISAFKGEYHFLSNFYPCIVRMPSQVLGRDLVFKSSEAAYMAAKSLSIGVWKQFETIEYAGQAKKLGRQIQLRDDWESVKIKFMQHIVRNKFVQNPDLAEKLKATGDVELIEGNYWGDTFWGVSLKTGQGQNHLGKILMAVRAEL